MRLNKGAFSGCTSLTSITIPDSVTSIGDSAFYRCCKLTNITIPDSVTSIGSQAFIGCTSLTKIYYSGNVNNWVQIDGIYILMEYVSSDKELYINGELLTEAVIDTAIEIKSYAFYKCSKLTSVTIGDSVTSIGSGAFSGCTSLTSITIPNSVTSIGGGAFSGCTSLEFNKYDNGLYLGNDNNPYEVLVEAKSEDITSCEINSKCKIIGDYAFYGCSSLTSVTIGDSVASIGDWAFRDCTSLTSVTIPDSVTSIGDSAFGGCTLLTSIVISDNVTSIGDYAFSGCSSLMSVTIGNGVTSIGRSAFKNCTSLTKVLWNAINCTKVGALAGFYDFTIFGNCTNLKFVTIGDDVTIIPAYAFYGCRSLKTINYKGSKEQWDAISKGSDWNSYAGSYTINYNYVEN